jgi:hypothetical protein
MPLTNRIGQFLKDNFLFVLVEFGLWVILLATIVWLWDLWLLNGPHGPYRWMGIDFAPFWVGVREMFHGANPYDIATTLKIQQVVYGGPAMSNDPMMFVYPAWMFILIAPFSLLPYKLAAVVYISILLCGMLNLLYLISWNLSKKDFITSTFWMTWLTLGSLPFLVISVTKGQLGYLSLIALFVARRIWKEQPYMAGIVLGIALIKPTVTVLPVAGFLLWALVDRDWKFLFGFLGFMMVLLTTSLLASRNWIPGYLAMLSIKGGMPVIWSIAILSNPWRVFYVAFFVALGVYAFFTSRRENKRDLWLSATFLFGMALFPMRWIYDLYISILILPEENDLSIIQTIVVAIAVASPWILVIVPEINRWNTAAVGLPMLWALSYLLMFITPRFFPSDLSSHM